MIKTLLPDNATPLEIAIEQAERLAVSEIATAAIYEQWHPEQCAPELLPILAWSLGVDYWHPAWSIQIQRDVIGAAVDSHRRKGTFSGIKDALWAAGISVNITRLPLHRIRARFTIRQSMSPNDESVINAELYRELSRIIRNHAMARNTEIIEVVVAQPANILLNAATVGITQLLEDVSPENPTTAHPQLLLINAATVGAQHVRHELLTHDKPELPMHWSLVGAVNVAQHAQILMETTA